MHSNHSPNPPLDALPAQTTPDSGGLLTGPVSVGEELPTIQAEQELRADLAEIDEDLHRLDQVIDRARKEEKDLEETGESVLGTDK